jgi:hypothetical protein
MLGPDSDGLDLMFWGIVLLAVGFILTEIGIFTSFIILIIGVIMDLVGLVGFIYGLNLFRRDYRMRVKGEVQYSRQAQTPPPQPPNPQGPRGTVYCPKCGNPAVYIPQYNRYYCNVDKEYI